MSVRYAFLDANMATVEDPVERKRASKKTWRTPPQRFPVPPEQNERLRGAVLRTLERLWELFDGELVKPVLDALARYRALPRERQERLSTLARAHTATPLPVAATKPEIARWMIGHAILRGLFVPGIGKRDLFVALVEGFAHDEEIAAVMDRSRDWRSEGGNARRQDQRKVMTRRSRLNGKRRQHGYR